MTNYRSPVSFNTEGTAAFNEWLIRYADHEVTPTTAAAYFNGIEYFYDDDIVARIELSRHDSKDHNPHVFDVTRDMVNYAEAD